MCGIVHNVCMLHHQHITIVGITSLSVDHEIIYSWHDSLDTRKIYKGLRGLLEPEGQHWGLCSIFAPDYVFRGFIAAK